MLLVSLLVRVAVGRCKGVEERLVGGRYHCQEVVPRVARTLSVSDIRVEGGLLDGVGDVDAVGGEVDLPSPQGTPPSRGRRALRELRDHRHVVVQALQVFAVECVTGDLHLHDMRLLRAR